MRKLELTQVRDPLLLENFKILQEFMEKAALTSEQFRCLEVFLTDNAAQVKIPHGLNFVPLDVIVSRLVAPSGAKLTLLYSEFTQTDIVVTVTGLSGVLNARLLVGKFPQVQTTNSQTRGDNEIQEYKCRL